MSENNSSAAGSQPDHKHVPWRKIFQELSAAFFWTAQEIAEMTLAQIFVYYLAAEPPGGKVTAQPGEASRLLERSRRQKEAWKNAAAGAIHRQDAKSAKGEKR